ncbi:MAG: PaaI family thioesterase [Pseudomonadota bacterium]
MSDVRETIQNSFSRQSLMTAFSARIDSIAPGEVVVSAPITDAVLQQHGVAHAGLTFALGDTAAGYAAISALKGAEVMTAEMKINLLAPGTGHRLRATGRVIRPGQRLVVVAADVHAMDNTGDAALIAVLQGTMVPMLPEHRGSG